MARVDLAYARSLLRVAEPADLLRVVARRVGEQLSRTPAPVAARRRRRPRRAPMRSGARRASSRPRRSPTTTACSFPTRWRGCACAPRRSCATRSTCSAWRARVGARIDWLRDPLTGKRCDGDGLFPEGVDPKGCWELARGGHLVELAAARACVPGELMRARARRDRRRDRQLPRRQRASGAASTTRRRSSWRCARCTGSPPSSSPAARRVSARVRRAAGRRARSPTAAFSPTHLEDRGIVPANHLLGNYVGLWALGLALDGAPHARGWQALAERGLAEEAARQVGSDGAHFEASTAYHRWALELMLAAHLWARAADRPSPVGETLHRMLIFVRNYVGPDGCEPAFGDGDDARLYPIVPHAGARARVPSARRCRAVRRSRAARAPARRFARRRCGCAGPRRAPRVELAAVDARRRRRRRFRRAACTSCAQRALAGRAALRLVRAEGRRRPRAQRSARVVALARRRAARSSTPAPAATPPTWCCAITSAAPPRTRPSIVDGQEQSPILRRAAVRAHRSGARAARACSRTRGARAIARRRARRLRAPALPRCATGGKLTLRRDLERRRRRGSAERPRRRPASTMRWHFALPVRPALPAAARARLARSSACSARSTAERACTIGDGRALRARAVYLTATDNRGNSRYFRQAMVGSRSRPLVSIAGLPYVSEDFDNASSFELEREGQPCRL